MRIYLVFPFGIAVDEGIRLYSHRSSPSDPSAAEPARPHLEESIKAVRDFNTSNSKAPPHVQKLIARAELQASTMAVVLALTPYSGPLLRGLKEAQRNIREVEHMLRTLKTDKKYAKTDPAMLWAVLFAAKAKITEASNAVKVAKIVVEAGRHLSAGHIRDQALPFIRQIIRTFSAFFALEWEKTMVKEGLFGKIDDCVDAFYDAFDPLKEVIEDDMSETLRAALEKAVTAVTWDVGGSAAKADETLEMDVFHFATALGRHLLEHEKIRTRKEEGFIDVTRVTMVLVGHALSHPSQHVTHFGQHSSRSANSASIRPPATRTHTLQSSPGMNGSSLPALIRPSPARNTTRCWGTESKRPSPCS